MSRLQAALGVLVLEIGVIVLVQSWVPTAPPPVAASAMVSTPTASAAASSTASSASAQPTATAIASPTATLLPPIPAGYRVQIPRLGIDLEIIEGDLERDTVQQKTPVDYAFHLPGSALPGAGANTYIYAHARTGMFLSLWNVRIGDVVWISTPDLRALKYVVSEIHPRVPPGDVSWTEPSAPERLTLQTSTGPNPGDPRFVVIALPG